MNDFVKQKKRVQNQLANRENKIAGKSYSKSIAFSDFDLFKDQWGAYKLFLAKISALNQNLFHTLKVHPEGFENRLEFLVNSRWNRLTEYEQNCLREYRNGSSKKT